MEPGISDKATGDAKSLQVVFLVDITGSMGSEIEGVKQMVAEFCEEDRAMIDVHIWTFTESPGCHVSKSPPGLKAKDLVNYTKKIKLCCPPDNPSVSAGGGDGPENVTAGLAALLDVFDASQNLLCFLITDAPPHHIAYGKGTERLAEEKWLKDKNFEDSDIFVVLCEVIDSLNATIIPVLFNNAHSNVWFQQAAAMTEGLILCPKSRDSKLLAKGLVLLLDTFQKLSESRDLQLLNNLDVEKVSEGFNILAIPDEVAIIETDMKNSQELVRNFQFISCAKDVLDKILGLFRTTIDRFSGKKAVKRCRTVNAEHMARSIKAFLLSLLYTTGSKLHDEGLLKAATNDLKALLTNLKETDQKYEWELNIFNKYLESLANIKRDFESGSTSANANNTIECMVSLEKVSESLQSLQQIPVSEQELSEWMELILQLCLVRLITVKFPPDASGSPDFADAWSASLTNIEYSSILSASSALQLRSKEDYTYTAPVSLHKNNVALLLAHPNDHHLTQIYKSLSFFPTLQGLIQSHLVSGSFKVFPSILQGLQASTFWYIIRNKHSKDFLDCEWEIVRCVVHSLRNSAYNVTPNVSSALRELKCLNPVDNVTKLLAGFLAFVNKREDLDMSVRMRLLFEEMSADAVMFEVRRAENYPEGEKNLPTEKQITESFVDFEELEKFDPCSGMHYLEDVAKGTQELRAGVLERIIEMLKKSCRTMQNVISVFKVVCRILDADLEKSVLDEALGQRFENVLSDELMQDLFVESFLIRKRTARYELDETSKEWKRESLDRVPEKVLNKAVVKIMSDTLQSTFVKWNQLRKDNILKSMLNKISNFQGETVKDYCNQLKVLDSRCGEIYIKFSRTHTLAALENISEPNLEQKLRTLGIALLLGDWTKAPPCELRRALPDILTKFALCPDLHSSLTAEISKAAVCSRPADRPNRHGHTSEMQFPGMRNWTQEYEDAVKALKKGNKKEAHLQKMKEITLYYQKIMEELVNTEKLCKDQREIIELCVCHSSNENELEKIKALVDGVVGVKWEELSGKGVWIEKVEEVKRKFKTSKHAYLYLKRLIEFGQGLEKEF